MGTAVAVSGGEVRVLGGSTLAFNGGETVTLDTASSSSWRLDLAHELVAAATAAARSGGRGGGGGRDCVWRAGPILLTPLCCCAAANISSVLHVAVGGGPGLDAPRGMQLASVQWLDPARAARGWRAVAPLSEPRAHAMLVEAGGLLYAEGGYSARLGELDWAEVIVFFCNFNIVVYGPCRTKW